MANEITASGSLSFNKSGRSASLSKVGLQIDMTGLDYVKLTQNVGFAAEEAMQLGDITTLGWCMLVNRSSTYEIKVRPATGVADLISLLPGEFAMFRMKATAPFVQAVTGAAELEILLIEA